MPLSWGMEKPAHQAEQPQTREQCEDWGMCWVVPPWLAKTLIPCVPPSLGSLFLRSGQGLCNGISLSRVGYKPLVASIMETSLPVAYCEEMQLPHWKLLYGKVYVTRKWRKFFKSQLGTEALSPRILKYCCLTSHVAELRSWPTPLSLQMRTQPPSFPAAWETVQENAPVGTGR